MLTKAAKYSIRATIYLALNSDEESKISAKKIAYDLEIPLPFLAKQLQLLSRSKLISSTKGPYGGFYLSGANAKQSLWEIITCIDGEEKFNECFLGKEECGHKNPCAVHEMVVLFRNQIRKEFHDKNIAEIATEIKNGKSISL